MQGKDRSHDPNSLRGKSVLTFFPLLLSLRRDIGEMRFSTYHREPGLSGRLKQMTLVKDMELRDIAERISNEGGIPYWNAFLAVVMSRKGMPERYVETSLAHGPDPLAQTFAVPRSKISIEHITDIINQLPENRGLVGLVQNLGQVTPSSTNEECSSSG